MNKRIVETSTWESGRRYKWRMDDDPNIVLWQWSEVEASYPQFAMMWEEGTFGGYEFQTKSGLIFKMTEGVRRMGYEGVIAFDSNGNGTIFTKD